jgi:hypothetical protein
LPETGKRLGFVVVDQRDELLIFERVVSEA